MLRVQTQTIVYTSAECPARTKNCQQLLTTEAPGLKVCWNMVASLRASAASLWALTRLLARGSQREGSRSATEGQQGMSTPRINIFFSLIFYLLSDPFRCFDGASLIHMAPAVSPAVDSSLKLRKDIGERHWRNHEKTSAFSSQSSRNPVLCN